MPECKSPSVRFVESNNGSMPEFKSSSVRFAEIYQQFDVLNVPRPLLGSLIVTTVRCQIANRPLLGLLRVTTVRCQNANRPLLGSLRVNNSSMSEMYLVLC